MAETEKPSVANPRTIEEVVKSALDSQKAPGILLASGSAIWKAICFWSNIDFLLSIREQKVAVVFELILNWGWFVLLVFGLLWAFFIKRQPAPPQPYNWKMTISVGILCFLSGVLVVTHATPTLPNVLVAWGSSLNDCSGVIDTSKLIGFSDGYKIVLICGVSDPRADPMDDERIAMSQPYTITGSLVSIDTPAGKMGEIIKQLPDGISVGVWHTVILFPKSEDITKMAKVSDFEKRGGVIVTEPKAGGFNQLTGKIALPTAPSPLQSSPVTPAPQLQKN